MGNFSNLSFNITTSSVTVTADGKPVTVTKGMANYEPLLAAIKSKDYDGVMSNLSLADNIERTTNGDVTVTQTGVFLKGQQIHGTLASRILYFYKEGFDIKPLKNFLVRIERNPSYDARQRLYEFLDYSKLPITPTGTFLAYKKVRSNFRDIYSGSFDNSPGTEHSMDRAGVDDNPNNTCSAGLHVCSHEYLPSFGSGSGNKVVLCEVDPENVVTVPTDYNNTKMRVCAYKVLQEVEGLLSDDEHNFTSNYTAYDSDEEYEELDDSLTDEEYEELDDEEFDDIDDTFSAYSHTENQMEFEFDDEDEELDDIGSTSSPTRGSLSDSQVRSIRRMVSQGQSKASVARQFDISPRSVGRIANRESYQHVS